MKFRKMWIGMLAAWFAVWGASARGALEHATVLGRQGDWEVIQKDDGATKSLFLASKESGARTQLASVEVSAETATNVYWDAFVGGMVTNVETIATPFEFNAFVNAGSVYWVDWEDGTPRLWTAPCGTPGMKSLLATGAAGTPLGARAFAAQPWHRGATWREEGAAGPERFVFENGKIARLAHAPLGASRKDAVRRVAIKSGMGSKSSGSWSVSDFETDHGYKMSGAWWPPSWDWESEWKSPFAGAQTVEIPDGVTKIGRYVFSECSDLEKVTGGKNVKTIGDGAFYNCYNLTGYAIPSGVKNIGRWTFSGCSGMSTVTIPYGVKNIGADAFNGCDSLTSVALPGSVTNIGPDAFYWCSGMTDLTMPNGLKSIGARAFFYCNGLTDVEIPASVVRIGDMAFANCSNLSSFQVASNNSSYKAVDGVLFTKDGKKLVCFPSAKMGSFTVPATVTSIADSAFDGCNGLTEVAMADGVKNFGTYAFAHSGLTVMTIPGSVTNIGYGAFSWCSGLPSVTIPNGVKNIDSSTFAGCSSLTNATIPGSVTNIGEMAFSYCDSLASLTIPDTVRGIGWGAFEECNGLETLYVPAAWESKYVKPSYWTTGWSGYWSSGGTSEDKVFWRTWAEVPEGCKVVYYNPRQWVTFDANGGFCETTSESYEIGGTYGSLPPATSSAGVLEGWYTAKTGGTKVTASSKVTNKTTRKLYARWTKKQKLNYNANGGKCSAKSKTVTIGKKYGALATATKAGVGFVGWADALEGGVPVTADDLVTVAAERTVYAQWTTEQTVTFDGNGGSSEVPKVTYTIGSTYGKLPGATSSTGVLEGWYTAKKGGTKVTATSKVTEKATRTLYAHWTKTQTLTYNANGGKCKTKTKKVTIGKKYGSLAAATKAGFGFIGWGDSPEGGVTVTADELVTAVAARTVYAQWTDTQTVAFDPNGGTTIWPESGGGETLTWGFDDSTSEGWTTIDSNGDGYDWMLRSQYTSNAESVPGHNGSADCMVSQSFVNNAAVTPDNWLVSPRVPLGGTFSLWACAQDASYPREHFGVFVSTNSNTDVASFEKIDEWTFPGNRNARAQSAWVKYSVDLSAYAGQSGYIAIRHFNCTDMFALLVDDIELTVGGSGTNAPVATNGTYTIGKVYEALPTAVQAGKAFAGWFTAKKGGTKITAASKVTDSAKRTLYAHWTTTQTLTYNANGGKCKTKSKKATVGKKYGTLATATKAGYGHAGWADKPEGGVAVTADDLVTEEAARTVYAQWTKTQVVTFDANGGDGGIPEGMYTIGETYGSLPTATKSGSAFVGWFTAKKDGTKVTATSKVTEKATRTLYAHWTKTQTLTYNANGGKCSTKTKKVTIGKTYGTLATATKAGVGFIGWGDAPESGVTVTATDTVPETAARTVYAQWTTNQVVTFDPNGGNIKTPEGTYTIGAAYGDLPTATKDGAAFAGWFTAKKDGTKVTVTSKVTEKATRTLYAHWTTTQTVTFNANGGKCSTKSKKYTVGKTYASLPTATWSGHEFSGWATEDGEFVAVGSAVPELAARTLYAQWDGVPKTKVKAPAEIHGISLGRGKGGEQLQSDMNTCVISVEEEAGVTYEIQWTPALGGEWRTLQRWVAAGDGTHEVEVQMPQEGTTGFLRVTVAEE